MRHPEGVSPKDPVLLSSFTGFFISLRFIQNDVCEISYIDVQEGSLWQTF